jgi:hypothetical protein
MHHRQLTFWAWGEPVWSSILGSSGRTFQKTVSSEAGVRLRLLVLAYQLCGLRRLHRCVGMVRLRQFADLVFGPGAVQAAVDEVSATLVSWRASERTIEWEVTNATLDLLLTYGSPRLEDVQEAQLVPLVAEYPAGTSRRKGLFKVSRVLAHQGIISAPLTSGHPHRGPYQETLDSVPAEWLEWALRWRPMATHEPGTVRGMFSMILIGGRWAAEKHPDTIGPDKWTRDMAAEYVADTLQAKVGQWAGICLRRVPQNKTSGPFSKPVDPVVGQLIDAWRLVRPAQPLLEDRKTHERREYLFCFRGQLVGATYLNDQVIPALCRKAGLPDADSRGALTSHRARATIATQLLNADEPLTLADLQPWLGHKHPSSTRHFAAILQRKLSAAYKKADFFARNVRTIQVLIDRDTILSGAAAGGEPWKYYDLGEGFCTYDFFARCPHRLACARCPLLPAEEVEQGPAAGGEGRHRSDARTSRPDRRGTGSPGGRP